MPIRNGTPVNGISDFNSIRFVRMFLTNFKIPVVIRFGELDLVRGDWRRYTRTIDPDIDPDRELTQAELEGFESNKIMEVIFNLQELSVNVCKDLQLCNCRMNNLLR